MNIIRKIVDDFISIVLFILYVTFLGILICY